MGKEIVERGHELENHSLTHPHMTNLEKEQIEHEVERVHHQIVDLTGHEPELFRAPFGDYNNLLIDTLEEMNYYPIQWSLDSMDWQAPDADYIEKKVMDDVGAGDIILFHNNATYTPEALDTILEQLIGEGEEEGYEIVPISELIYKDNYEIDTNTGVQKHESTSIDLENSDLDEND
ncbi:polysaccharide deacetylase [Natranaerobius thermophilus JW/NM-WN-LF]|uniref:Polysaccharide deacetylase n=2 Tax=Natranaerobius TaxID=375928 RepID=B2A5B4_NATTJ|nr:polysaccharide deacetylase [Natranaerobius thermophilus JW/NM-WN-LF]